jgi:hypothetical protein
VEAFFTPQEIEVAALIREGRSSKEMAALMNLSLTTIEVYSDVNNGHIVPIEDGIMGAHAGAAHCGSLHI